MAPESGSDHPLLLNGFEVELPAEVDVLVVPMVDPADVKVERIDFSGYWFVHWLGGKLYCLRLKAGGPNPSGTPARLHTNEHPWLLRARLDDMIETVFERYAALRHRPFTFLSQRDEIVAAAAKKARLTHPLLADFMILPKFSLHAKVIEPADGEFRVGLLVTLRHALRSECRPSGAGDCGR